jgi:hypothetical protein
MGAEVHFISTLSRGKYFLRIFFSDLNDVVTSILFIHRLWEQESLGKNDGPMV